MNACKNGCNRPIAKGNVFCGRSCSASWNNRVSPKRSSPKKHCLECKKSIKPCRRFCSNDCHASSLRKSFIALWLKGERSGLVGVTVSGHVRSHLLKMCGGACERCNTSIWLGNPILLQVDHKDGDYRNCSPQNLWMICPNCHAQQPTSGSRNCGRGRKSRLAYTTRQNDLVRKVIKLGSLPALA